ncbi:helix-turn-helix domain-containing protein [Nocardia sp. NPDC059240]|uniref:GbsR/MarR family transcriptional regulator n=1 Tax=Nocardia sp. NPDC059240 TaxID=3346786 RepID=UPI0036B225A6
MPGSRLSRADRELIGAGLARGLDHAEIARRLGRPTSTVTREVARNGGPGRYRADLAQLATTHRARRTPRPPAAPPSEAAEIPGMPAEFVAELTGVLIDNGMPRTAAGVLAHLFTVESASATALELAVRLRVSPATISHAVHVLMQQGLVVRTRDAGSRRHRYSLDEEAGYRSALIGFTANRRLAATVRRGANLLGPGSVAAARLEMSGRFLEALGDDVLRAAEHHWRTIVRTPTGSAGQPSHPTS